MPSAEKTAEVGCAEFSDVDGKRLSSEAAQATQAEHELTFTQAVKLYKKAVIWSVIVSLACIMDSYDMQIVSAFYAYPSFQKKYGELLDDGSYSIPASWQLGLSLTSNFGMIIGVFVNGWLVEHMGPRRLMLCSFTALTGFIFITFFAPNIQVLLVGELLCGLPWGVFAAVAPSYAVEVCPLVLRGYLSTFCNLTWPAGRILATGVLQGLIHNPTEWSYRIPFALQWMWPVPLSLAICFAPESPWWQVRKGRIADAEATMKRLCSGDPADVDRRSKQTVAMITHTIQMERDLNVGTNYIDCFRGINLRRTEIASVSWGGQVLTGFAIQNYLTYFFKQAGLSTDDSFKLSLGTFSIAFLGTVFSWFFQGRYGRRSIFISGLCIMAPIMWLIALIDFAPATSARRWAQCCIMLLWFAVYGLTIGPVPYAIATEVPASRLRMKTIAVGRNAYYIFSIVNIVVAPYLLNPSEANLHGKAAFPAAGFSTLLLLWAWFRLPETKNRTFEELDVLFEREIPARKFAATVLETPHSPDAQVVKS
ncbi:putative maltose permease [Lasiodiplodia theobromae]|uniref:putative maltose permease n=1 Tax=Lasiodiplodia theobromae TaxID=45133 RepID=UPI0015C30671|nr:putative maltose permease [Lasiodiplodia theobromae]KAF4539636.1 putative maltose permease [Lasiodiplodia theobromae]